MVVLGEVSYISKREKAKTYVQLAYTAEDVVQMKFYLKI